MDSTAQTALGTQKQSMNSCNGRQMDSTAQTTPRDSEIINKVL